MTAQEIFKQSGYQTADNRSINWRNINKAMAFGIIPFPVPLGKERTLRSGSSWKLVLQFEKEDGTWFKRYFKPNCFDRFISGKWQSSSQDVISYYTLEAILLFKEILTKEGFLDDIQIAKERGMCVCSKCKGKGKIPAFMHYCKGVCFDCMGLGYGNQGKISA